MAANPNTKNKMRVMQMFHGSNNAVDMSVESRSEHALALNNGETNHDEYVNNMA